MPETFDSFRQVKGAEKAVELFKELSTLPRWYMLLCYGSAGCGKTHLCQALSSELNCQRIYCPVHNWFDIIRNLKEAMHSEGQLYDFRLEALRKAKTLIIDDVGMGTTGSNWEWGVFEEIINYRYNRGLLTVVTTNLDLKALPERVVSRFRDVVTSRTALNSAEDFRPRRDCKPPRASPWLFPTQPH